jgi:hypothetical protein
VQPFMQEPASSSLLAGQERTTSVPMEGYFLAGRKRGSLEVVVEDIKN